jgi:hypothetical protein
MRRFAASGWEIVPPFLNDKAKMSLDFSLKNTDLVNYGHQTKSAEMDDIMKIYVEATIPTFKEDWLKIIFPKL